MSNTTTGFIDLTPAGCTTPDGIERTNKTLEAWQNAQANLANETARFLQYNAGWLIETLKNINEPDLVTEISDLQDKAKKMNRLQEDFLRAVSGAPARVSK
jgi:hypothetical protein